VVLDLGRARAGDWRGVAGDIWAVRNTAGGVVLKVILETALLDDAEIVRACEAAEAAGANFVKTSTGFSPAGGATVDAVRLMAKTVGGRLGVKASGGIRSAQDALAMLGAGATRLGCSATRAILDGIEASPPG
jgi:deoxyribose-phosphate aldolase